MNGDMVISSRIRLARNIEGYPLTLDDGRADILINSVAAKLKKIDKFTLYRMSEFSSAAALAMMERHLISPDLIKNKRYGAAIVNDDESVCIMLNEEDHIREQCILKGFSLREAFNRLSLIDRTLNGEIKFAIDPKRGYVTACPTNTGTGMRASVMMFLPALTLTNNLENCMSSIGEITVRGVYGEGSDFSGFVYQISNRHSLGAAENLVASVEAAARHIATVERSAREYLFNSSHMRIRDKIMRSYGILSNCCLLSHNEFINLAAFIKLGVYYGILSNSDVDGFEELIMETGPASISALISGKSSAERDCARAQIVRETVKKSIVIQD